MSEQPSLVWRYIAKFGNDCVKLTTSLETALDFVKRVGFSRWTQGERQTQDIGFDRPLHAFACKITPGECIRREYWIRPDAAPLFKVGQKLLLDDWLAKIDREKFWRSGAHWSIKAPIQLKVRRLVKTGEIKIPGQPYQPATETWVETKWVPVYITPNSFSGGVATLVAEETDQRYEHLFHSGTIEFVQTEE